MLGKRSFLGNPLNTDDCLRAVDVSRRWRALMVFLLAVCLLLLQASFYLVDLGFIAIPGQLSENKPTTSGNEMEANPVLQLIPKWLPAESISKVTFEQLTWMIHLVSVVLVLAAVIYCLTLLSSFNASINGGLGGTKHITRALLLSLLMLVLLPPWQKLFGGVVTGAMFTADEIAKSSSSKGEEMLEIILYYLRFSGYGIVMVLLLISSGLRSLLWIKAIVRRLETKVEPMSVHRPASPSQLSGRIATS